jgi:hypothetical protein
MNPGFLLLLLLCGCASIETKTSLSQRVGEELSAGVGDAVIRLNSEKNLPNVFGKSDVFGRTTPTGITTVVYAGVFGGNMITAGFQKLFSAIRDATNEEVEFARQAENLGVDNTGLHEMVDTFEHFGGSLSTVTGLFGKLSAAKAKFLSGDAKMGNSFAALGISKEQAADMSNMELFNAIAGKYSATRGGGDVGVAAGSIFGRGMNKPATRRSLIAYGAGERYGAQIAGVDVADANDQEAQALKVSTDKMTRMYKGMKNILVRGWAEIITVNKETYGAMDRMNDALSGNVFKAIFGTARGTINAELGKKSVNQEEEKKQSADAITRANAEAAQKKKDTDAENARFAKEQAEERIAGMNMHGPAADSYARRGLFAGGAPVNNAAYTIGRQQVQLTRELLESSRRIESNLRHKETLQAIKNRGVMGEQEIDAGEVD